MYHTIRLSNSLTLVYERIPHFRSVSLGVWINAGSAGEQDGEHGLSHFTEHMLFKGTDTRTAAQIAAQMDAVGGNLNAFTTKECTCLYVRVVDEHMPLAVDVLADLTQRPLMERTALDREKLVVLEEIAMTEDSPEDLVSELISEAFFGGHALGLPILGRPCDVSAYEREAVVDFFHSRYHNDNFVFSAVGNFDPEVLQELLLRHFVQKNGHNGPPCALLPELGARRFIAKEKDVEQMHITLGYRGYPSGADDVFALLVLNSMFGGGMSSRLFQKIREEHGLVYSVYSYPSSYRQAGMMGIYAGLSPGNLPKMMAIVNQEIDDFVQGRFTEEEFLRAREQLRGSYVLGLDSITARMSDMGRNMLLRGAVRTEEEVLRHIAAVEMDDIVRVARHVFDPHHMAAAAAGKLGRIPSLEKTLLG